MARLVSKQYIEDIDEDAGFAYRYWELVVDVEGEEFGVRIYRDDTGRASVAAGLESEHTTRSWVR